jgi:hypothetical protein
MSANFFLRRARISLWRKKVFLIRKKPSPHKEKYVPVERLTALVPGDKIRNCVLIEAVPKLKFWDSNL